MIFKETLQLADNISVPRLGLGVWMIPDDKTAQAVRQAVKLGYRHIDTAQAYFNEAGTGEGIRSCGVKREEIFVTSKIAAEHKTYKAAAASIDASLSKAGLDYLDLMLIHSPQPWQEWRGKKRYFEENKEVWRALTDAQRAGKVRAVGVANFLQDDLESLLSDCEVRPAVNQILLHIGNTPLKLLEYCRQQGIAIEAYSPLGHGVMVRDKILAGMAARYGVSPAQLCIRYTLQLGAVTLPKTQNPERMLENASLAFEISEADMEKLKHARMSGDYGQFGKFPVFSLKEQE